MHVHVCMLIIYSNPLSLSLFWFSTSLCTFSLFLSVFFPPPSLSLHSFIHSLTHTHMYMYNYYMYVHVDRNRRMTMNRDSNASWRRWESKQTQKWISWKCIRERCTIERTRRYATPGTQPLQRERGQWRSRESWRKSVNTFIMSKSMQLCTCTCYTICR